jgi:hypothetical protein
VSWIGSASSGIAIFAGLFDHPYCALFICSALGRITRGLHRVSGYIALFVPLIGKCMQYQICKIFVPSAVEAGGNSRDS